MKKEIYEKRCYNYIERYANQTTPSNYESFYSYLKSTILIHRPWVYNQIIGYIVISFYQNSIWFDEYATLDKKIHATGNKKHFIQDMMLNGYHFFVPRNMPDVEIKQNIIDMPWGGFAEECGSASRLLLLGTGNERTNPSACCLV